MDAATKAYIDSLDIKSVPWSRMFTAYGTAERYAELFSELEQAADADQWQKTFFRLSDFEHQSTLFPPAPFALVFLVRMLRNRLEDGKPDEIANRMIDQFAYYVGICDQNLLPEGYTEDDLLNVFEDPEAVSDELFYSFYYYSLLVLSQVPDVLDRSGMYSEESKRIREELRPIADMLA